MIFTNSFRVSLVKTKNGRKVVKLKVPMPNKRQQGYHPKGHVHSLNAKGLKEGDDIHAYQTSMREVVTGLGDVPANNVDKGYQLEILCRRSAMVVNQQHQPPTRRAHKQHWSIVLLALKAQLNFLGPVRGALRRTKHI